LKNFLEWIKVEMSLKRDNERIVHWLQGMFTRYAERPVLESLLQTRLKELTDKDGNQDCLNHSKQPLGSILLLIREEFAKLEKERKPRSRLSSTSKDLQDVSFKPGKNMIANALFKSIGNKKQEDRMELLSKMLSKINYFSHFVPETRKKLIEISQH
jgi:hypothetical protein